jgi:type IV secretory pathway TrbF-like protein
MYFARLMLHKRELLYSGKNDDKDTEYLKACRKWDKVIRHMLSKFDGWKTSWTDVILNDKELQPWR